MSTGYANLRRHLHKIHPNEYDYAARKHNWNVRLSIVSDEDSAHKAARAERNADIPRFSSTAFLEYLVRFIVADDQVRASQ